MLTLVQGSVLKMDARLQGPTMTVQELLALEEDEVLAFDYPVDRPVDLLLNGTNKFQGDIINTGRKRSFHIRRVLPPEESSLTVVPS